MDESEHHGKLPHQEVYKERNRRLIMLISKTLKCKIFYPTQKKLELLNQEYSNFQIYHNIAGKPTPLMGDVV